MTTTTINRRPDHDHWHSHNHDHAVSVVGSARSAERAPTGHTVVFDIGDGIGALIVRLDDRRAGTELPIECIDGPSLHVHTGVWRRVMNGNDVVIVSGEIADLDLRTAPAAS